MSALRSSVLDALAWCVASLRHTWRKPHRRATPSQILLLVAVVANLQFAATLTHAWYFENVQVRLALDCALGSPTAVVTWCLCVAQNYPRSRTALWPSWT